MPKLPGFDSKVAPTVLPSNTMVDIQSAGQGGRDLQSIGKALGTVADSWQKSVNFAHTQSKKTELSTAISDIGTRASQDTDIGNSAKYHTELDEAYKKSLEGFTDNTAKQTFDVDAVNAVSKSKILIDSSFRKKIINHGNATRLVDENERKSLYLKTGDESLIKKQKEANKEWFKNGFTTEVDEAKSNIGADNWKVERVAYQEKNKKLIEFERKDKQINNETEVLTGFANNQLLWLQPPDVDSMVKAGDIREETASVWKDYMYDPAMFDRAAAKNPALVQHYKAILNIKNKEEQADAINNILKNKSMTVTDLGIFMKLAYRRASQFDTSTTSGYKEGSNQPVADASLDDIIKWSEGLPETNASSMIRNYVVELEKNGDTSKAAEKVKYNELVNHYPEVAKMGRAPNMIVKKDDNLTFFDFTGDAELYPASIWNESTQTFEVNFNRAKSNKE